MLWATGAENMDQILLDCLLEGAGLRVVSTPELPRDKRSGWLSV